jgi:hypothetical protein
MTVFHPFSTTPAISSIIVAKVGRSPADLIPLSLWDLIPLSLRDLILPEVPFRGLSLREGSHQGDALAVKSL